jgi:hypothetical protein
MPRWNNAPLDLYHGTDSHSLSGIQLAQGKPLVGFSVDLGVCRANTDFGKGFYMTTSEHQARNWANIRVRRRASRSPGTKAMLLSFKVDRDWLASLDALCFVLPCQSFFDFVEDCRSGVPPHQRADPRLAYDVVYGPVTLWPQDMVVAGADQVSIHTTSAATGLPTPQVVDIAGTPDGLFERART